MKKTIRKKFACQLKIILFFLSANIFALPAYSEISQTLLLKDLLAQAQNYYPTLLAASLDKTAANSELEAAYRLRWPTLSAIAESASTSKTTSVPTRALQLEQTLWDGGNINSKIEESKSLLETQTYKELLTQEEIYLQIINAWQTLLSSRERMVVAKQTLEKLNEYQQQMIRRIKLKASPAIDIELVRSRILQTQVEHTNALNNLKQAAIKIEQYTGRKDIAGLAVKYDINSNKYPADVFEMTIKKSDLEQVINQHPAINKAKSEVSQSQSRFEQKKSESMPQVYARVTQPLANQGTSLTSGPTVFFGIKYSTSPGFSNKLQEQALANKIASANELVNAVAHDLTQLIKNDEAEYYSAKSRIESLEQTVQSAERVHISYQKQYKAAKKSWQDLLNSEREVAQNKYLLADARASMRCAMHRLQIRMRMDVL